MVKSEIPGRGLKRSAWEVEPQGLRFEFPFLHLKTPLSSSSQGSCSMQIPEGLPSWVPYLSQFYWTLISVPAILVLALSIGYRFSRDGQLVLGRQQGTSVRVSRRLGFFTDSRSRRLR